RSAGRTVMTNPWPGRGAMHTMVCVLEKGTEGPIERSAPGASRIPQASRVRGIVRTLMTAATARRPRLEAKTLVQFLPGLGPARAALPGRLGIVPLEDLPSHVPREYLDARRTVTIERIPRAGIVPVVVEVDAVETRRTPRRVDLAARVHDSSGAM